MTSSMSVEAAGPARGDLLIAKDKAEKKAYTLSVVPGRPQMRCPTYERAVLTASAWASRQHVAIWLTEDGRAFTPVRMTGKWAAASEVKKPHETA